MKTWMTLLLLCWMPAAFAQSASSVHFLGVEIYIDSREQPLAAYQLEFWATNAAVKIVGVEGGESPAFKEAPYYDPRAIQHERVIIAAFSTDSPGKLPKGKTRVATIHLQVTGDSNPDYRLKLEAAADNQGRRISGEATFEKGKGL